MVLLWSLFLGLAGIAFVIYGINLLVLGVKTFIAGKEEEEL